MADLSDAVRNHYISNKDSLPFDKQFHLASRLYLWSGDKETKPILDELRSWYTRDGDPELAFQDILKAAANSPVHGSANATELRRPYFEKYPKLKTSVMLLFRLAFLRSIYGIDARPAFFKVCPADELDQLATDLLADQDALAILSTHAINFLYLYRRFVTNDEAGFEPEQFRQIAHDTYDLSYKLHLQLYIYLYTHCIIGESMFYSRQLPTTNIEIYRQMIVELEDIIDANFSDINLDNKFEFLVCARMVGVRSKLEDAIYAEAANSISDAGMYLVDRHNNHPQSNNIDLDKSEHRNVLFVMTHSPFTAPH